MKEGAPALCPQTLMLAQLTAAVVKKVKYGQFGCGKARGIIALNSKKLYIVLLFLPAGLSNDALYQKIFGHPEG